MKKFAKKIIAAVAGVAAVAACALPLSAGEVKPGIACAESATASYALDLANEYKMQNGVKMSPTAYVDVVRSCTHYPSRAGDTNTFTAVFDKAATSGREFTKLWVYTTSYGATWGNDPATVDAVISGKPFVKDTDGTVFRWTGSGIGTDAGGTIKTTSSVANSATGGVYLDNTNGLNLDKNSSRWYVFSTADNAALQSEAGETSGLQTLESFSWGINHYQLATHFEIGTVYGETASGEKIKLFDPATCSVKSAEEAGAGNYIYVTGNQKTCFTVTKKINENNFDLSGAGSGWKEFTLPLAALGKDISAYNAISFRVKNPSDKPVFFNKFFTEATATDGLVNADGTPFTGDKREFWYDNVNYAISKVGSVTQNGVSSQVIPAGFDGKITIPFSSFVTPDWKELPDHASRLDLDDIASLTLTFMLNDTYSKGSLALSDFALEPNVEVNFSTKSWFQWEDGRYLEFVPNGHKAADGADFTPDKTATFNGKEYVLDEDMSRYLKTDAAAYTNGRPAVRRSGGAVTVNYRPNLYYRLKDDFTLEKAFYPEATKTVYPKGTTAQTILAAMPDGFAFGNQYGGIMQLDGAWSVKTATATEVELEFTPTVIPSNVVIADRGVFVVKVGIAANYPPIASIKVSKPIKTIFGKGDALELGGLVVTATDADGNERTLAANEYDVSGYDPTKIGEQTITVTAAGKTAAFTVTVTDKKIAPSGDTSNDKKTGCAAAANALGALAAILGAAFIIRRK